MHTKEEITKRKSLSSGSDISENDDSVDVKLRKKRFYIILAIASTIGLSLVFIIYRQVKEFLKNPVIELPKISLVALPKLSESTDTHPDLSGIISEIVKSSGSKWNIVVAEKSNIYNWINNQSVYNQTQINTAISDMSAVTPSIISGFPEGLIIKSKSSTSDTIQKLTLLITPPGRQLFMDFIFSGSQTEFQNIITVLAPEIYWKIIVQNN